MATFIYLLCESVEHPLLFDYGHAVVNVRTHVPDGCLLHNFGQYPDQYCSILFLFALSM